MGYPVGEEKQVNGGFFQEFEHSNIYWSMDSGAHYILKGDIFDEWGKHGYEQGEFGWPTEDYKEIPAGGLTQTFQHGVIRKVMGTVQADKK